MKKWNKLLLLVWTAALPLLLSGCMLSASAEDLYALPELPKEYESLSAQLSAIQASGAEYAPPQTGANLPPVQMVDLNGDGVQEALAFFRVSGEERPLKIYIFQAARDGYEQAAVIEGSGASIHSFLYRDMDGDGIQEVIVSWSVSAEVQAMSVYTLSGLQPAQVMSTPYARYEVVDLDGDEDLELVVLRSDDVETGGLSLADYYDWDGDGSLQLVSSARLSASVAAVQWMQVGSLMSGETAVFVTSRAVSEDVPQAITDILVWRHPDLTNVVLSSDTGVSTQIFRSLNLQPTDIDADGSTEVPMPTALPSEGEGDPYWKIYWFGYDAGGNSQMRVITYHNFTDGWYLIVPDEWDGHFTVRQSSAGTSQHSTTFFSARGRNIDQELLTIDAFTGSDREAQAARNGRAILRRRTGPDTVYTISFREEYDKWRYAVPAEVLSGGFNAIINRWSMGEN